MRLAIILSLITAPGSVLSTTLYAAVADGTIRTLHLSGSQLSISSSIVACGSSPSWLTATSDLIYCSGEATPGTLSTLAHTASGVLTLEATTSTIGGDVSNVIYGNGKFIAVAHYGHSSISTFTLPITNSSKPLNTYNLPFPGPGPNPRQNTGYPHQVTLDPSGKFLFSPDLGADVVRVFSIDAITGNLAQLPDIKTESGSGPRHGAFYQTSTSTFFYLASELTSTVSGYRMDVNKTTGKPNFTEIIAPFHPVLSGVDPANTFVAETRVSGNTLTVSVRGDQTFGSGMDSLSVFNIGTDGKLSNMRSYSAGGNWPRSFQISQDGSMVVVGDQKSKMAVVMKRNQTTGAIGDKIANVTLPGEVIDVVWA